MKPLTDQKRRIFCGGIFLTGMLPLPFAFSAKDDKPHTAKTNPKTIASESVIAPDKVLRLAIVPQLTPVEMTRNWTPIVEALKQAGVACELIVYPTIAKFEQEFFKQLADILFLNPYHMVMAQQSANYIPLLRDARPLEGVLVVKSESKINTIADLKAQKISFPAPNAFAASLYIRSVLELSHHLAYNTHYAGNHRNAIRQVLVDDSAAAGIVKTTLENETAEIQSQLRIIYSTPKLSAHPIAVHPRVPPEIRQRIKDCLIALASNPETQGLMKAIQIPNPQVAHYVNDYAALAKMNIEKFVVLE